MFCMQGDCYGGELAPFSHDEIGRVLMGVIDRANGALSGNVLVDCMIIASEISSGCSEKKSALFARPIGLGITLSGRRLSRRRSGICKADEEAVIPSAMQLNRRKMKRMRVDRVGF